MSIKRQATSDLNHENWDQEDPSDHEEIGIFKSAPKDVLEKRVIRTAKRRNQGQSGDEAKKSVFSGFGGFNKTQPSSFDFLANLTNGNKPTNGTATSKTETPASSGLFSSKPAASSPGSSLFSTPVTSTSKPVFGSSTSSSLFGGSTTATTQSPFGSTKMETTATDSPFKMQTGKSNNNTGNSDAFKITNNKTNSTFGITFTSNNNSNNSSPNKIVNSFGISKTTSGEVAEKKNEKKTDDKKMIYYTKLKGLNESVSDWIKKHVEETPLCILSPIFKDYEKHLKEIQEEYNGKQEETKKPSEIPSETKPSPTKASNDSNNTGSSLFSSTNAKPSLFGNKPATTASSSDKPSGFSFGVNTSSTASTTSGGFSFGVTPTPQTTTAPSTGLFSFAPKPASGSNGPAPFSFSSDKPFSFSSNIAQKPAEPAKEEKDDDDEPPKVEFTPVVEENSVFDKKCKIFLKKDGNFIDKGVGTLYIKKVEENNKHQLLVRANTNLGTVLLNLILSSSIPTQRLGKNNVMLACIPTPDAKPPPTPVLIRVKTSEEADELLETLNKYKV